MPILVAPHPRLSRRCRDDFVVTLGQIKEMFALLRACNLLGLAAPQVGIDARVFVTKWGEVFVNPRVSMTFGYSRQIEGCASLPGQEFETQRASTIVLADGRHFQGLRSIVIQHELDHLDGVLISYFGEAV
jgi:peptide deformylase